jgi:NAD(P)-dependent dehydrogenase (short-subunit alcohol dehydrogenase family)
MNAFATAVHERVEALDILMNNAGVGLGATFLDTRLEDWDWILGVNLLGVIHGCYYFLPAMVRRGRGGHVINVSSIAAFVAGEPLLAYSTTKFGVLGMSEALRGEMRSHGIGVTAVCPGIINTGIVEAARLRGEHGTPDARRRALELYKGRNYSPQRAAENILKAVQKNRRVAPISPEAWILYYLKRFTPGLLGWANRRLNAYLQAPG